MKDIVNLQWSWLASSGDFDAVVTDTSARLVPKPSHPSAFVLKSLPCPNPIFICSCPKTPEMVLNYIGPLLSLSWTKLLSGEGWEQLSWWKHPDPDSCWWNLHLYWRYWQGIWWHWKWHQNRNSRILMKSYFSYRLSLANSVWLLLSQLVALKEMPTHQKKPTKGTYSRKVIDKGVWGQHDLVFEQPWLSTISWGTTTDQQRYPEIHEISC